MVITAVIFLVRLAVALYFARADERAAETYRQRHAAQLIARGWPAE